MCYSCKEMAATENPGISRLKTTPHNHTTRWATPLSYKIKGSESLLDSPESDSGTQECEKLADIVLNKSLNVFQVSPLYKFSFRKNALKALTRKISHYIQKILPLDAEEINFKTKDAFTVNVNRVKGFHNDIAGILLTVRRFLDIDDDDDDPDNIKEEFWGLLCRPNLDKDQNHSNILKSDSFMKLPLLFVKGNASLTNSIISFFMQQFDCSIRKLVFTPSELAWLGAMWAGYSVDTPQKPLLLKYCGPENITGITKITMVIDARNVIELWRSTHDETSDEFLLEELQAFTKSLSLHFEAILKINLSAFSLMEINATSLQVKASGKVKMLARKTSPRILAHLESLAERMIF